ncbi:MAG TPA: TonB-dependent siderophore receptor [Ramlibacter sp.]|nr:TonB-dependent siderophore receptor [Ramlibacter sp.]
MPLGAMMLAASAGAWAQASGSETRTLPTVTVREKADVPEGKDSVRATTTTIGKGNQELRNIPQSITVVTEKLADDRNLDTVKDVLRNTAGISFQAAEGGEEDIRLRGYSLAGTGDIFLDGMRDPAFYDRDTFNNDRIELLRGSASMLFGRGSTGGAVNQVSKVPRLINQHEVTTTLGSHNYRRVTGDFNLHTGENAALRINAMATKADNNGAGSSIDKNGLAAAYRWGIGTGNEFMASLYYLNNNNGINYGMPWIRPRSTDTTAANTIIYGLSPTAYYGMASDYNNGLAQIATLSHLHRFQDGSELKTQVRKGSFERDQRAGTVRFANAATSLQNFGPSTVFNRGTQLKIQDVDTLHAQSDYSTKFKAWGLQHELQAGVDFAHEEKTVFAARSAAQGGVDLAKPQTRAGTPNDGAWIDESRRVLRIGSQFDAKAYGAYVQDLVQIAPMWKVLGGLRYDSMDGAYDCFSVPGGTAGCGLTGAVAVNTTTTYRQKISAWSKRVGALYQPNDLHSYHFSYGTSFNTSGDTYSYSPQSANTPPEQSENIELGAKLDSASKQWTTRLAVFRSTKKNERNTDPDTAATRMLLSGKRHSAGIEVDISGRLTPKWEVFGSYMWMPIARVDVAASTATTVGNRVGDRPGLSPKHSGTIWTTYQLTPQWRVGGGLNFRSRQAPADVTAPAWEAPGFVTADLMAEYAINQQFIVKANLSNITDKLYADSLYRGHYIPGAGRMLQVSLTARF